MSKRNRRARRPDPAIAKAQAKVERAIDPFVSKQPRFGATDPRKVFTSIYRWLQDELQKEPKYSVDSRVRDLWLAEVWRKEPHIAGVVSSVTSIDTNRGWWIAGGRNQVNRYNAILRRCEGGAGWRYYMAQGPQAYYTSDLGFLTEVARDGGPDGPMRDLFFLDSSRCYLTGNPLLPLSYTPDNSREQKWTPTDFFRVTNMPSTNEALRGLGFCSLSRAIQFIQIMFAVYEHDKEMLGAKAPRGLLLLQNVGQQQWIDAMTSRAANLTQQERDYYAGVSIIAQEGVDQIDAKLIALSQLPANFDLEVTTNLMMYGLALIFERDPREFWPVSQGTLGTGQESKIQHTKASAKGGLSFVLSYQDQIQQELPAQLEFEFEQRDIEGELVEATVKKAWADVAAVLFQNGMGPLTYDETRVWLADAGVIPAEWASMTDEVTVESSGEVSGVKRSKSKTKAEAASAWTEKESMWASAFAFPDEPLIRRNHLGKTEYLFGTGYDFLHSNKTHKMARAMAYEYGAYNPFIARSLFGRSFQVLQPLALAVKRASEILYSEGGITITQGDVDQAIEDGGKRVGKEFAEILQAS